MQGAIHRGTPQTNDETGQTRQEESSSAKVENEELALESAETERCSSINENEDTQSSSCVVINVDMDSSAYECADGDSSSLLSSKTCSVEDISSTGVQEEVKAVSHDEKVVDEVISGAPLEEVRQEQESMGTEDNVGASVEIPKLSNESSSVSVEEEEEEDDEAASVKRGESREYINPRGVRFMSQEVGQDGE